MICKRYFGKRHSMWHKFRFHFNSSALTAFFVLTAVGFIILLLAILSSSLHAEKITNLRHAENLILKGITGSILGSAELNSQGLKLESETLMQDYLNYTFENNKNNFQTNYIDRISVYFLNPNSSPPSKQLIGEWANDTPASSDCIERRTEYLQPSPTANTYLIDLSLNTCSKSNLSLMEYHALSTPILVAMAILIVWGLCVYMMIRSVGYAGRLLARTDKILWTNVNMLSQKALQVRGRNLQYYQTLVLDAQHDISKILDVINSKYDEKDINHGVSIVRNIIQKLATEVRSNDMPSHDVTSHREMNAAEISKLLEIYYSGCLIDTDLPDNLCLHIADMSLFERILVNLSSNAVRNAIEIPTVKVKFEGGFLKLRVFTPISDFGAFKLHFAKLTYRIDVKNPESPVYVKFFGRTGRGLSIIKRGIFKLGGQLIFTINNKVVESGFDLPAHLIQKVLDNCLYPQVKKRAILFNNPEFQAIAIERGLKEFIITQDEVQKLLTNGINLEIVSDFELTVPPNSTLRILSKKERIEGIALNWLGENKV